jgi:hypothetical protein
MRIDAIEAKAGLYKEEGPLPANATLSTSRAESSGSTVEACPSTHTPGEPPH